MKNFWTAGNSGKICDEPQTLHHPRVGKITGWNVCGKRHETAHLPWNKFHTILSPARDCYMSETVCFIFFRCHVPRHCLFHFTIFFNQGDVNFISHILPTFQTICFDKNWNQLTTFVLPRLDSKFKIPKKMVARWRPIKTSNPTHNQSKHFWANYVFALQIAYV